MHNFETRFPRHQFDFSPPHERTSTRPSSGPVRQTLRQNPRSRASRTMEHVSSKISRRRVCSQDSSPTGQPPGHPHRSPSLLISTTRSSAVTQKAFAPWGLPKGTAVGELPCDQPIAAVRVNRILFAVARDKIPKYCHSHTSTHAAVTRIPLQGPSALLAFDPSRPSSTGCSICNFLRCPPQLRAHRRFHGCCIRAPPGGEFQFPGR